MPPERHVRGIYFSVPVPGLRAHITHVLRVYI